MNMIAAAIASGQGSDCILWPYWRDKDGYARAPEGAKSFAVHRRSCEVKNGKAPSHKPHALHSCGNGHLGCINPHHLFWGNHVENMSQMVAEGRSTFGAKNPRAKLTEVEVLTIRASAAHCSKAALARRFGVGETAIRKIVTRQSWAHI